MQDDVKEHLEDPADEEDAVFLDEDDSEDDDWGQEGRGDNFEPDKDED